MMKVFIIIALFLFSIELSAQEEKKQDSLAIMGIISDIFDGMRTSDSSIMGRHFHGDAIMQTIGANKEGINVLSKTSSPKAWLSAVARPKTQVWDERTWGHQLQLDDKLASVWMDYAFYIDEDFSHCGVNSFTLAKIDDVWKIIYIIDTRNKDNCIFPSENK